LKKAQELVNRLQKDAENNTLAPIHQKQLSLFSANVILLERDYKVAKEKLRSCLKMNFDPKTTAEILNNLAYASWKHSEQLERKGGKADEEELKAAAKDKEYIISWLKEAL